MSTLGTRFICPSDQPGTIRWCQGKIFLQGKNLASEKKPENFVVSGTFIYKRWTPNSSIPCEDKVFDPVAVETLLGDEKLNRASGDVESHISIRWATLLVVRQVWESWSKPHNLYVSGRMVWTWEIEGWRVKVQVIPCMIPHTHFSLAGTNILDLQILFVRSSLDWPATGLQMCLALARVVACSRLEKVE